jgi:hypothetical protein
MFQLITKFSSELRDDIQFKKSQRSKENEIMDAIEANSNLYKKYPNNILPLCGIFEALININDFEGATLFYNKYADQIDSRYLFLFDPLIKKLNNISSNKKPNPYLKFYGCYEGSLVTDNKSKPSVLKLSVTSKQFFDVILVIDESHYLTCKLSLNGDLNSYEDYFSNDPNDIDDSDQTIGNGTIDKLFKINLNYELVSHYAPSMKFNFNGIKKTDYFNSVQTDFILKESASLKTSWLTKVLNWF